MAKAMAHPHAQHMHELGGDTSGHLLSIVYTQSCELRLLSSQPSLEMAISKYGQRKHAVSVCSGFFFFF